MLESEINSRNGTVLTAPGGSRASDAAGIARSTILRRGRNCLEQAVSSRVVSDQAAILSVPGGKPLARSRFYAPAAPGRACSPSAWTSARRTVPALAGGVRHRKFELSGRPSDRRLNRISRYGIYRSRTRDGARNFRSHALRVGGRGI